MSTIRATIVGVVWQRPVSGLEWSGRIVMTTMATAMVAVAHTSHVLNVGLFHGAPARHALYGYAGVLAILAVRDNATIAGHSLHIAGMTLAPLALVGRASSFAELVATGRTDLIGTTIFHAAAGYLLLHFHYARIKKGHQ